jgi:hypothetical protein
MRTHRMLQMFASLALVAFFACAQPLQAQENHRPHANKIVVPLQKSHTSNFTPAQTALPTPNLYWLQASFTADYPIISANADKTDLWVCANQYLGPAGSNPDCPTLGDPSIPFPAGGLVSGVPGYSWPLQNQVGVGNGFGCDALVNGTSGPLANQYNPCGQILTSYEDDTFDSTDDLLQRIVVRQGDKIIYDSGTVDYGPAGPGVDYPAVAFLTYDTNFGFWPGASNGPNNGNCSPNYSYPLTSATFPGGMYVVESGTTCQEPVPGLATFTSYIALATPTYTKVTGERCASLGVASPCYTVKWTKNYEIHQDWNIFLN